MKFDVTKFREDHNLSQTKLSEVLGIAQPSASINEKRGSISEKSLSILRHKYGSVVDNYKRKKQTVVASDNLQTEFIAELKERIKSQDKMINILQDQLEFIRDQLKSKA